MNGIWVSFNAFSNANFVLPFEMNENVLSFCPSLWDYDEVTHSEVQPWKKTRFAFSSLRFSCDLSNLKLESKALKMEIGNTGGFKCTIVPIYEA